MSFNKVIKNGFKWSAIERILTQTIQFIVLIILGRILGPESFGLIGMMALFIAIGQVLVDSGLGASLIRVKDVSQDDLSTVFIFNVITSVSIYIFLYIFAPFLADFYNEKILTILLRVASLSIIINSLLVVQKAMLTRDLNFKVLSKISLISVSISSFVALITVYNGGGVWALVFQSLSFSFANVCLYTYYHPWIPKLVFNKESFNNFFGFGSKLLLSSLLDTIYTNVYQVIIGRIFTANTLGQFTQAKSLASIPSITLTTIIQRVSYPALSKIYQAGEAIENKHSRLMRQLSLIVFSLYIALAFSGKDIVKILLGDNWAFSGEYLSILAFGFMLYPINGLNLNILHVKGESSAFLKLEVIKKAIFSLLLYLFYKEGVYTICIIMVATFYLELYINSIYVSRYSTYTFKKLIFDIYKPFFLCLASAFLSNAIVKKVAVEGFWSLILFFMIYLSLIIMVKLIWKDEL